jgi:hypothetical protein
MMPDETLPQPHQDPPTGTQTPPDATAGHTTHPEPPTGLRQAATRWLGRIRKPNTGTGTGHTARTATGKGAKR